MDTSGGCFFTIEVRLVALVLLGGLVDFRLRQVSAGTEGMFKNERSLLGRDSAEVMHILWVEPFATMGVEVFQGPLERGMGLI